MTDYGETGVDSTETAKDSTLELPKRHAVCMYGFLSSAGTFALDDAFCLLCLGQHHLKVRGNLEGTPSALFDLIHGDTCDAKRRVERGGVSEA